jgi:hypothetical protein
MRIRIDKAANYRAVFLPNGKTLRFKLDQSKPFSTPSHPEIEDVAINNRCLAKCSYCYTSAVSSGQNFTNIIEKADKVWGSLPIEERPFQIAIGGAGESTLHPGWSAFVKRVSELGIVPNYTTNGMHLTQKVLASTEKHCGGVALSWHPHIKRVFHESVEKLTSIKTRLNFHIIVGTEHSLQDLQALYERYNDKVEYFVILPYQAAGRGKKIETTGIWRETFKWIASVKSDKFAFGALFYNFIQQEKIPLDMSIYEPEMFSGYRMLDDNFDVLYRSSYDLTPKHEKLISISTRSRS